MEFKIFSDFRKNFKKKYPKICSNCNVVNPRFLLKKTKYFLKIFVLLSKILLIIFKLFNQVKNEISFNN